MTAFEPLTASCGCGAVRLEIRAELGAAVYCHCTRCQHRTGTAASATVRTQPGSVLVTAGAEHVRAWAPPGGMEKAFCELCGSAVVVRDPATHEITAVRLGAFDGDPGVRPSAHQFVAYAAPWEPLPDDGLPRYDERMPS
jgi:hypothetical protein